MSIAYKEARETRYWLKLHSETNYLDNDKASSHLNEIEELCRIIGKIQKTIKEKLNKN